LLDGEDIMFYQDKVILGEAKLLADWVKNEYGHPKTDELERGCVMDRGSAIVRGEPKR
jgi:hypothetical protein